LSHENVAVVRRFLTRINEQKLDAALSDVALDAELDWSGSEGPDSGVYRGPERWGEWITGRWEGLQDARFDATEVIDAPPNRVVVVAHLRGRGRTSGVQTAALGAAVWTLHQGKVTGLRLYQTREEALTAVGLEDG
jgi:ketosteroid isomerase-like protein